MKQQLLGLLLGLTLCSGILWAAGGYNPGSTVSFIKDGSYVQVQSTSSPGPGNYPLPVTPMGPDGTLGLTVNQGIPGPSSSPWPVIDAADGPVTPGAVASKSSLAGGQFNTVLPTLTNGQQAALQVNASGQLSIRPLTSADVVTATNPSVGTNGAVIPASSTLVGASDGTNLQPLRITGSGALKTDASATTQPVSGTVAATQSGVWNITNISGTVSLPTGAATDATVALVQGTVAAGTAAAKASLSAGQFNTVLPTLTNTQQAALQVTSSGKLIVDGSTVTQPVSGTVTATNAANGSTGAAVPATATFVGGSDASGNLQGLSLGAANALNSTLVGKTAVTHVRNDYSSVNVTTAAYVQLIASTSSAVTELEIFDSSGQTLVLATGAAASEVDQIFITPGGNGRVPLTIGSGVRVSIKAVSATANAGEIDINVYK